MNRPITIYDPARMVSDRFLDNFLGNLGVSWGSSANEIEMFEDENNVVVKIKAPGFNKDNIEVTVEDNVLTVTGTVRDEQQEEDKSKKYYYRELKTESFVRSVSLPSRVVAEKAAAEFKDGIMSITMPKAEDAKPKKITIQAS